ncbi:MAG: hypothetical protein GX643_00110 [Acidimicrobiales bacterium]|nr:hypothetical protein [Acidimicrobiales bacterium]
MPLTERSRHKLYETFTDLVDDEKAVEEMLSYFPARDVEEPVTKDFLRAELQREIGTVRLEIGTVRLEISDLRTEVQQMARNTQIWIISTGLSLAGLTLAGLTFAVTRFA